MWLFDWLFPSHISWDVGTGEELSQHWMQYRLPAHEERTRAEMNSVVVRKREGKRESTSNTIKLG